MTTPDVRAPYLVAVMGFGGFEQQALDSYLGLARARSPAYAPCATVEDAQFVIANGDRGGVLDLLAAAQRTGDTVLIGQAQVAGVAAMLARPIDPLHLFRALDEAVKHRSLAATAARASPRNVTMAELSTPWTNEDQRGAAFYAPPGPPLGRSPGGPAPSASSERGGPGPRAQAVPDAKPRGERPGRRWVEADQSGASPRLDAPSTLRRTGRAPDRQSLDWLGSQLGSQFLPTDPSIPSRQVPGRRHADHAQARPVLSPVEGPLGRDVEAPSGMTPGPTPGRFQGGTVPAGVEIPTLALVSNEEPELGVNAAVALRAPPARMPAARPAEQALAALVIDPDAAALAPLFAAQNVKATTVAKAHHAFAMLDAFAFDVIVIDMELGANSELDGLQVCQAIGRQQRAPGEWCPPIVLMSAQPSALEQARGMLAGANVYLAKPPRPATLAQALILAGLRPAWTPADVGGTAEPGAEPDPNRASR
jgi:CheY-like chemotaxis protein